MRKKHVVRLSDPERAVLSEVVRKFKGTSCRCGKPATRNIASVSAAL